MTFELLPYSTFQPPEDRLETWSFRTSLALPQPPHRSHSQANSHWQATSAISYNHETRQLRVAKVTTLSVADMASEGKPGSKDPTVDSADQRHNPEAWRRLADAFDR